MKISINHKETAVLDGETLIETAHRTGVEIPSLCYAKNAVHKSSCMVCAVKDCKSGQIIPACTTLPVEGMQIDTESEDVALTRTLSLELLLSDHRADCEAPCTLVCPHGLDVAQVIYYDDNREAGKAFDLVAKAFALPEVKCSDCKAPCEKACRRGTVDKAVSIREVVVRIAGSPFFTQEKPSSPVRVETFKSRLGRFTEAEKERLKATVATPSRCLHCACSGKDQCRLRTIAAAAGIKRMRYALSSVLPMEKIHIHTHLWFEPAKCIRCGLCVYNSDNGFTFKGRGFKMEVVLPEENKAGINENIADLCPTGAIYKCNTN